MTWPTPYEHSTGLRARREARDRRDGRRAPYSHALGCCGYMASLCSDCTNDELGELTAWAATAPAPKPGENFNTYWRRICDEAEAITGKPTGSWVDVWCTVAARRIRDAGLPGINPTVQAAIKKASPR